MKKMQWLGAVGLAAMACGAQAGDFSVGAVAGTLGVGGQVSYAWTERVQTRAMVAGFSTDVDFTADGGSDLDYSGNVDLLHGALLLDYHPFGGVFRLTGGVMLNDDKINGSAVCEQTTCDLGDNEGILVQGDRLDATARYDSVSPYIGFGWGKSPGAEGGLGFSADIGVFYLGDPDVNVELSGASSVNPIARDAVEEEKDGIQDDLDKLPIYPVVMLGLDYRF
ncbi:hypothetical protein [Salinisphaera sp.]|uniref:hypothetical protein n=1 Tax=Salinisphaera sp. TaxID=1914330 RepID=UPI000C3B58DD|nr:hypothetical protein [Salinisphaera sp.]MBS63904.1 hypothetical protein [Salinisphaera sp.]